jgi:NAD(P)-dependent dehydrogenase (short-subunit alcohol dehydrogenase family)
MTTRVFITGGASGLGKALATRYARDGARVCIGDLNDARGEATRKGLEASGGTALYRHCDVTREADLQKVADELNALWGGVDILVNNAGVAQAGPIDKVELTDWEWIININLLGVVRGCKAFVPMLKRQRRGSIINIASMAGLLDVPNMASYNVTKAAVVALSGTLTQELMGDGITVSVACPSFFMTNLEESMRTTDPTLQHTMRKLLARGKLSADQVANTIVDGAARGEHLILPHADAATAWFAKRFLPNSLYHALFHRNVRRMMPTR